MEITVIDYVWIVYTQYRSIHKIGVVCDNGRAYACTKKEPVPKLGQKVDPVSDSVWNLQGDTYHPLTKLHKHLYGLEHEI
jgi:hypothetical protein